MFVHARMCVCVCGYGEWKSNLQFSHLITLICPIFSVLLRGISKILTARKNMPFPPTITLYSRVKFRLILIKYNRIYRICYLKLHACALCTSLTFRSHKYCNKNSLFTSVISSIYCVTYRVFFTPTTLARDICDVTFENCVHLWTLGTEVQMFDVCRWGNQSAMEIARESFYTGDCTRVICIAQVARS